MQRCYGRNTMPAPIASAQSSVVAGTPSALSSASLSGSAVLSAGGACQAAWQRPLHGRNKRKPVILRQLKRLPLSAVLVGSLYPLCSPMVCLGL
jgi:hypothetical protein